MTFKRKLKRKQAVKKKKQIKKDMNQKMSLLDTFPVNCLICNSSFDKSNKEQINTWHMVIPEEKNKINLYCPTCWEKQSSEI